MKILTENNIKCEGTICSDRVEMTPFRDMKKEPMGSYEVLQDNENGVAFVHWQDNSMVTVATN